MDQLNGKDFMFACSESFFRLWQEVCSPLWKLLPRMLPRMLPLMTEPSYGMVPI